MNRIVKLTFALTILILFIGCAAQSDMVQDTGRQRYQPADYNQGESEEMSQFRVVDRKTVSTGLPRFQREFSEGREIDIPLHISDKMGRQLQYALIDPAVNTMMIFVKCDRKIDDDIIREIESSGALVNTYSGDICTIRADKVDLFALAELDFIRYMLLSSRREPSMRERRTTYSDR